MASRGATVIWHINLNLVEADVVAIVDYKAGNLRSVLRACNHVGVQAEITNDPDKIANARRVIFPGVGQAQSAMETLKNLGLDKALRTAHQTGTPILGICLGTQIVLSHSEEGDVQCLGLELGNVKQFILDDPTMKIPHMGWNAIQVLRPHPLLEGVEDGDEFYFVHSYYPADVNQDHILAVTEYGHTFCSVFGSGNLFATQFHPEKSGRFGLAILERFARWDGTVPVREDTGC